MKHMGTMTLSMRLSVSIRGIEVIDFYNVLLTRLAIILALGVVFGFGTKVESQESEIQESTLTLERRIGTITRDVINVRSCASTSCSITERLHRDHKEDVLGEEDGQSIQGVSLWYEIESGYVWSELMSVSVIHTCFEPEEVTVSEAIGTADDPHLYCAAGAVAKDLWIAVWDYTWREPSDNTERMFVSSENRILELSLKVWCVSDESPTCDLYKSDFTILGSDFAEDLPWLINEDISVKIRAGGSKSTKITLNFEVPNDTDNVEELVLYSSTFDGPAYFNIGHREELPDAEQDSLQE